MSRARWDVCVVHNCVAIKVDNHVNHMQKNKKRMSGFSFVYIHCWFCKFSHQIEMRWERYFLMPSPAAVHENFSIFSCFAMERRRSLVVIYLIFRSEVFSLLSVRNERIFCWFLSFLLAVVLCSCSFLLFYNSFFCAQRDYDRIKNCGMAMVKEEKKSNSESQTLIKTR